MPQRLQETPNIRKKDNFFKIGKIGGLKPLQINQFGSKIKILRKKIVKNKS